MKIKSGERGRMHFGKTETEVIYENYHKCNPKIPKKKKKQNRREMYII